MSEDPLIPAASGPRGSHESQAGHPESRIARRGRDFSREQFMIGSRRGSSPEGIQGARRMPWRREPTKGAASRDSPGGAAHRPRSRGARMGEPSRRGPATRASGRQPGELKHLSTPRRGNQEETPPVAASERGPAQTGAREKRAGAAAPGLRMRRPGPARPGRSHKARAQRKTHGKARGTGLEPRTRRHVPAGRSPEYRRARGTRREAGGTAPQG